MNTNRQETAIDTLITCLSANDLPRSVDLTGVKRDNIVLEKYLRVGDLVVMHLDEESRHYRKDVSDGTIGIVSHFTRYKDYHPRINNWGQESGVYMKNGVAEIVWIDGSVSQPGAGSLRWLTDHEEKQKQRRDDRAGSDEYDRADRLSDLPDLLLWEMDTVRIIKGHQPWQHTDIVRVERIDYRNLDSTRDDGSPMPIYDCTPLEKGYGRCSFEETEVELVERGSLWKWFNGQRAQVRFDSLEEEIAFHFALDQEEQVKCEQSKSYHWPFAAILPALRAGTIDVIKRSGGFFGASDSMAGHKLTDPDLSRRVREESIRGYTQDLKMRVLSDTWDDFTCHYVIRRALEFGVPFINVMHESGYVDTTQLELLGIPVVRYDPVESPSQCPSGSYIFFSPKANAAFDLPHASTHEIDEDTEKANRAFKRSYDDHFEVRVQSDSGWSEKNRDRVIAACKAFGVPFADRAGVADEVMRASGIDVVVVADGEETPLTFEIDGYVFFTHRGLQDLPYHVTIQGDKE